MTAWLLPLLYVNRKRNALLATISYAGSKKVVLCYPCFLDGLLAAMVSSKNVCLALSNREC